MKRVVILFLSVFFIFTDRGLPQTGIRTYNFKEFQPFLNRTNDTVYVINFWATWCGPCRKELPDLEKLHLDYSGEKVRVLLVSLDFPDDVNGSLLPFIKQNNITAEVLLLDDPDSNAWIDRVYPSWSGALPATLIYKKNERKFFNKAIDYDIANEAVSNLLIN
jgi:thiol-disulfide isomerase/thioredoxin